MDIRANSVAKWHFLSSFWIKIIAIISMTFDHLGINLEMFYLPANHPLIIAFRVIGRLSMPLFCFMIYEGVMHTKHFGKYCLRLGVVASLISILLFVISEMKIGFERDIGNVFIDLLLGAVGIYLLNRKEVHFKILSILPVAIAVLSSIASYYESTGTLIHWYPFVLRTQYHYYAVILIYVFYFCKLLKDVILEQISTNSGIAIENLTDTPLERNVYNILYFTAVFVLTMLYYFVNPLSVNNIQLWAILAGALLLFYNGKRGYNKKWFQYTCYVYYPAHIGILYLIFYLLTL